MDNTMYNADPHNDQVAALFIVSLLIALYFQTSTK